MEQLGPGETILSIGDALSIQAHPHSKAMVET